MASFRQFSPEGLDLLGGVSGRCPVVCRYHIPPLAMSLYWSPPVRDFDADSLPLLILTHHKRSVAVFRRECSHYQVSCPVIPVTSELNRAVGPQDVFAVIQSTFPSLRSSRHSDLVLLGTLPEYGNVSGVELSETIWGVVRNTVPRVTIVYRWGASPVASDNVAAVVDRRNFIRSRELRVYCCLIPNGLGRSDKYVARSYCIQLFSAS